MTVLGQWASEQNWGKIDCIVSAGIEPEDLVKVVREYTDRTHMICVVPLESEATVEDEKTTVIKDPIDLRTLIATKYKPWHEIYLLPGADVPRAVIEGLKSAIGDGEIISAQHDCTIRSHSADWCTLGLKLLPRMIGRVPINAYNGVLDGRTGIVVGAGPSLDRNIEELKKWEGKATIAAVSTVLPALAKHGIQPDMVCVVDYKEPNNNDGSSFFEYISSLDVWRRARAVLGIHTPEKAWNFPAKYGVSPVIQEVLGFGNWLSNVIQVDRLILGGCVATLAYSVLAMLGHKRIILVGCDNAYSDTEKLYADGIDRTFPIREEAEQEVERWGGIGTVKASLEFNSYRQWFEFQSKKLAKNGVKTINANEGGARMHGIEEQYLTKVPKDLDSFDSNELLESITDVQPIDGRSIVQNLEKQLATLNDWKLRSLEFMQNQDRQFEIIDETLKLTEEQPLLASMSVCSMKDAMIAPSKDQLEAQYSQFKQIAEQVDVLSDLISGCLKEVKSV